MTAVQITKKNEEKLKSLRLEYFKKHETKMTYQMIVNKLLGKASLKDIE